VLGWSVGDEDCDGDWDGLPVGDGDVADGDTEGEPDTVGDGDSDGDTVGLAVGDAEGVAQADDELPG
jgi:hypothetical protein